MNWFVVTGAPYTELIKIAVLPALVSCIALVYIVHPGALKPCLKGLPKPASTLPLANKLTGFLTGFPGIAALAAGLARDGGVMAAHRPELRDYLLGPNAARVVRHARQSVLVVRD